ncbi:MAG TPA: O-fucosyltransferase family protein [Acidobacteriaceae bacterium]|jgi:hypothetical protein|nr:O-fucosyltransferase family protein [Acidobacteriaceae bacterium]
MDARTPALTGFRERYLAVNEGYGRPLSLALTRRGHYSEVNCLLAAMIYGLVHHRRLIVNESDFEGLRWSELYHSTLPSAPLSVRDSIEPAWRDMKVGDYAFQKLRDRPKRRHDWHFPVWNSELGVHSVFSLARHLAEAFCQLADGATLPAMPDRYIAIHIRRGDKIIPGFHRGQILPPEAVDKPAADYVAAMRAKVPDVRHVWVMTDDYAAVEQLRSAAPDYTFQTMCLRSESGYTQDGFSALSTVEKLAQRKRLITETEVAIRSSAFIGPYLSNVSRFIALRHRDPRNCFSIDRQRRWFPG